MTDREVYEVLKSMKDRTSSQCAEALDAAIAKFKPPEPKLKPDRPVMMDSAGDGTTDLVGYSRLYCSGPTNIRPLFTEEEVMDIAVAWGTSAIFREFMRVRLHSLAYVQEEE